MANQKDIGVNLKFSADVTAAKKSMLDLQNQLTQINNLSTTSKIGSVYSADINAAAQAAAQLKIQLQNAFNQDTGKLNLVKFNTQLKESGMTLEQYRQQLVAIGPEGQKAFNKLAYNIATADTRVLSLSKSMQRFGVTFANTIRYQMSSSVIMAFTSSVKEAVGYVKDLNEALTDIRIVTKYSSEEMKTFATQANKAAKALSTTTNEYAKASLIYFQQGLDDSEVQKRTDLTIKMANVTGQAVAEVSDQLTAVWNNFNDGTKSLEHYVDVMVALGAATASSTDEISEGLNKFAAVAETVGLSYEYAGSSFASVTASTRQSADIVGTAFKTLFARIQDLELGETLDDGTTLGLYSQALASVGIDIKTTSGEIKSMNSILDEMGAKWNSLSKDTQIALAQSVAGVRQYTQLIALMDNYDYFKENLDVANMSSGALQSQQEIYAESWEAASERVTAALETIYNKLIDDDFFIDVLDTFTGLFEIIDKMIDGLGGLPGVLSLVGAALTKVFSPQIVSAATGLATTFMSMTSSGRKKLAQQQQEASGAIYDATKTSGVAGVQNEGMRRQMEMQQSYNRNRDNMSDTTRKSFEVRMQAVESQYENLFSSKDYQDAQQLEKDAKKANFTQRKAYESLESVDESIKKDYIKRLDDETQNLRQSSAAQQINAKLNVEAEFTDIYSENTAKAEQSLEEMVSRLRSIGVEGEQASEALKNVVGENTAQECVEYADKVKKAKEALEELKQAEQSGDQGVIETARGKYNDAVAGLSEYNTKIEENTKKIEENAKTVLLEDSSNEQLIESNILAGQTLGELYVDMSNVGQSSNDVAERMDKAGASVIGFGQKIQAASNFIMSASMAINAFKGMLNVLDNEEMSVGDKLISIFSSLAMVIPMVTAALQAENVARLMGVSIKTTEGAITSANTKNKLINATATLVQKVAGDGLNATMAVTIAMYALLAIGIIAVVGAITLIVKAIKDQQAAWNKDAIAAEKANKALRSQTEIVNELKSAYDGLKRSIESYTETQTKIDAMIEGTKEWKEAVLDSNKAISDLIAQYPELSKYVNSINGRLQISQEGLDLVQDKEYRALQAGYAAQYSAQAYANETNITARRTEFMRERGDRFTAEDWTNIVSSSLSEAADVASSVSDNQGAQAGAAIAGLITGLTKASKEDKKEENNLTNELEKLSQQYKEQGGDFLARYADEVKILANGNAAVEAALMDAEKHIVDLVDSEIRLEQANQLLREETAKNTLALMRGGSESTSPYDDLIATIASASLKEGTQQYANADAYVSGMTSKELSDAYLQYMGLDANQYKIESKNGEYKIIAKDAETGAWDNENAKTLDEAQMKTYVREQKILESVYKDEINEITAQAKGYVDALKTAGVGQKETEQDAEYTARLVNYAQQFIRGDTIDFSSLSYKDVESLNNEFALSSSALKASSQDELAKAIGEAISNYQQSYETRNQQSTASYVAGFDTQEATERSKIYSAAGLDAEGFAAYSKQLSQFGKNADDVAEKALGIANGLDGIRTALDDSQDALASNDLTDPNFIAAIKSVRDSLTSWLGVDLGYDYTAKNLSLIQDAVAGSEEAIKELSFQAAQVTLDNFGLPQQTETSLDNFITKIQDLDSAGKLITGENGLALGLSKQFNGLSETVKNGQMSLEKLDVIFKALGFEMSYLTDSAGDFLAIDWKNTIFTGFSYGAGLATLDNEDAKKSKLKKYDDEIERFYKEKRAIEEVQRSLDHLGKVKDRAYGKNKIAAMDAEIAALDDMAEAQNKYNQTVEKAIKDDYAEISKHGFKIGDDGQITNYEEIMRGAINDYNRTGDEEAYDNIVKALERYNESLNLLKDGQQTFIDLQNQIKDASLEKIEYQVEYRVEINESDMKYLEKQFKSIKDDAESAAGAVALLGQNLQKSLDNVDIYKKAVERIFADSDIDLDKLLAGDSSVLDNIQLTDAQITALKQYRDALYDSSDALNTFYDDVMGRVNGAFQDSNEEAEEHISKIEHLGKTLETYQNIIDLVGADALGLTDEAVRALGRAQVEASRSPLRALYTQ